jgi:hypothetical protein
VTAWRDHLAKVRQQLTRAFLYQQVWTGMRDEIVRRHPQADGTFLVCMSEWYIQSQLMLVRRLADRMSQPDSLTNLILRIKRRPDVLTRSRFGDDWARTSEDPSELAHGLAVWEDRYADTADPDHLNPRMLDEDLARLKAELKVLTNWATKTIAHLDPKVPERVPVYGEVSEGLAVLADVFNRYENLLNQSVVAFDMVTIQGDWHAPFRPSLFPLDPGIFMWPHPAGYT